MYLSPYFELFKSFSFYQKIKYKTDEDDRTNIEEISVSNENFKCEFECNAWISSNKEKTFRTTTKLNKKPSLASLKPIKYEVVVVTADEKGLLIVLYVVVQKIKSKC